MPSFIPTAAPSSRTALQHQNLSDALSVFDWHTDYPWIIRDIEIKDEAIEYHSSGGWKYLSLLKQLSLYIERQTEGLMLYLDDGLLLPGREREDISKTEIRRIARCFVMMTWDSEREVEHMEETTVESLYDGTHHRMDDYYALSPCTQVLFHRILKYIVRDIFDALGFPNMVVRWREQYRRVRVHHRGKRLLSDKSVDHVGSVVAISYLFHLCFRYYIPQMILACEDVEQVRGFLIWEAQKVRQLNEFLHVRLQADVNGTAVEREKELIDGWIWARTFGPLL